MNLAKYSIILATYNEKQNLPIVVYFIEKELKEIEINFEIIIVDDNSPDGTLDTVKELEELYGTELIHLIARPQRTSLGSAYIEALTKASGDFIIIMDADLSNNPKYISLMIDKQRERDYDEVIGSRFVNDNSNSGVHGWSFDKRITFCSSRYFSNLLLTPNTSDPTSSFRLYKKRRFELLLKVCNSRQAHSARSLLLEMSVRAQQLNFSIAEIATISIERIYGESKSNVDSFTYWGTILSLFFQIDY